MILDPVGDDAERAAQLWWVMVVAGAVAFVVVALALIVAIRRSSEPDEATGRRWLLGGGIAMPIVLIAVVLVATIATMRATSEAGDAAIRIEVTGHRWWWEVRYPDDDVVTANEVHVPAGVPVRLELTSGDVIHSFWVPDLAGKMDALPDGVNELVVGADEPGVHDGVCAEFCGIQHANMGVVVVVHDGADYAAWLDGQRRPAVAPVGDQAIAGAELFEQRGCAGCHTVRGTDAAGDEGPDLTHVGGRRAIGGGVASTSADDLRRWIMDPHALKEGVLMPKPELDAAELDAIVAYVSGLR